MEDQWLGLELSGPCTYRESRPAKSFAESMGQKEASSSEGAQCLLLRRTHTVRYLYLCVRYLYLKLLGPSYVEKTIFLNI